MGTVKVLSANFTSNYICYHMRSVRRIVTVSFSRSAPPCISQDLSSEASILSRKSLLYQQKRHFLPKLYNPFGDKGGGKKLRYSENHLLGYSMDQMFEIAAKVEQYPQFVPWCRESVITKRNVGDSFDCRLTVGFPPVVECYTSRVTITKPYIVKSVCSDGLIFNHLETVWKFSKGMDNRPDTCTLDFYVDFEFRSVLHTKLAQMFFDEVVRTMVNAFLKRAQTLYGPQSLKISQRRKIVKYNPSDS